MIVTKDDMSYHTCREYTKWYLEAKPGDLFVYYTGSCLLDNSASIAVKKLTWSYALKGWVYLTQERLDRHLYRYRALKAENKNPKLIPLNYDLGHNSRTSSLNRRVHSGED